MATYLLLGAFMSVIMVFGSQSNILQYSEDRAIILTTIRIQC